MPEVIHYEVPDDICGPEEPDRERDLLVFFFSFGQLILPFRRSRAPPQTMRHRFLLFANRVSKLWRPPKDVEGVLFSLSLVPFLLPLLPPRTSSSLSLVHVLLFFFLARRIWKSMSARSSVSGINLESDKNVRLLAFAWRFRA